MKRIILTFIFFIVSFSISYAETIKNWPGGARTGAQIGSDSTNLAVGLDSGTQDYYATLDAIMDFMRTGFTGSASVNGTANIVTSGSSTTVDIPVADYALIKVGSTLTANAITRYVVRLLGSNQVQVNSSVDWDNDSSGYEYTHQEPVFLTKNPTGIGIMFVASDTTFGIVTSGGDVHFWCDSSGNVTIGGNVTMGTTNLFGGIYKTVTNPNDADLLLIGRNSLASAITPRKVWGIAVGGTSVVVQILECDTAGANCAAIHDALTVDTDGAFTTTFTDASIAAGAVLKLDIGTVTGVVTQLMVGVE
jgi:hypothetical protein